MTVRTLETDRTPIKHYDHARLEKRRWFLRWLVREIGFRFLAKIDSVEGQENVPSTGPGIVMINHIAFIDSIVTLQLTPRNIVPMAKIEVYNYPVVGIFPRLWDVIPVHREGNDRRAIQQALEVLKAGEMILVAPEGTRHTAIRDVKEGAAYLASRAGAPIIPVAIDGTPGFPALRFSARWRGPGARVRFGKPFRFCLEGRDAHTHLRQMADEAMYILAAMLPPDRRGEYADLSKATQETIEWV